MFSPNASSGHPEQVDHPAKARTLPLKEKPASILKNSFKIPGSDYSGPVVWIDYQQILIAGHQVIGIRLFRAGQYFIVLRIPVTKETIRSVHGLLASETLVTKELLRDRTKDREHEGPKLGKRRTR
jgi:hypothetical protein